VRIGTEFDIDIQHHWCWLNHWRWLKWWDSFRCSLLSAVEPHECGERAQADDPSRAPQPCIDVPGVRDYFCSLPPSQHSKTKTAPDGGSNIVTCPQSH